MNERIMRLARPNIVNMVPYSSARDEYTGSAARVLLDANENPWGEHNRYPDPYQRKLKELVAEVKGVPAENIFLGNGSDEVIDIAYRVFCEPGQDKALIFTPTYGMYKVAAAVNNVELLQQPLDAGYQVDMQALEPLLADERLKLIFICTPNNPTGNLAGRARVEYILQNFKGMVVLDEAYIDFSGAESWAARLAEYDNMIVCQTFSKAWGMAGIRLGAAYMHKDVLALYNKVKAPYNINSLTQQYAAALLQQQEKHLSYVDTLVAERGRMHKALEMLCMVQQVYPSSANFILARFNNSRQVYERLAAEGIIIRDRGSDVPGSLRFTIGRPEENEQVISILKQMDNG